MSRAPAETARRAIVIGGSIAGLFVAAFLRRIGWQVDIYERSSIELIGRGVGIFASHLELFEALDKCGAGTVDIGVIVYKRVTLDPKGEVVAEKPQLQIVTSWGRLRQGLLKAADRQRYHFCHAFEGVEQDGRGVHVRFANGGSERADLLVGCDGFRSSVRAHLAPDVQPIYSGYYLWRGAPNESDLSPETRKTMFLIFPFSSVIRFRPLATPFRAWTTICATATGATISHGTAWQTARSCNRCAWTNTATTTNLASHRRWCVRT